jgi:hypothetical protein
MFNARKENGNAGKAVYSRRLSELPMRTNFTAIDWNA